jgi:hypothetical protein
LEKGIIEVKCKNCKNFSTFKGGDDQSMFLAEAN